MRYTLISENLSLSVDSKGAELCSIKHQNGYEYLWQGDAGIWPRRAPVLFPIVGKLRNNAYSLAKQQYTLPQHGFARDLEFVVIKQDAGEIVLELTSNESTKPLFPFDFELKLAYSLVNNSLTSSYSVRNTGPQTMYFSIGAHPGFNVSFVRQNETQFPYIECEQRALTAKKLSSGLISRESYTLALPEKRLSLTPELFHNDALVMEAAQINSLSLYPEPTGRKITLFCPGWPYFGIWAKPNPKNGSMEFVCLEPWHGIADSIDHSGELKNKKGIISLEPDKTFEASFVLGFF